MLKKQYLPEVVHDVKVEDIDDILLGDWADSRTEGAVLVVLSRNHVWSLTQLYSVDFLQSRIGVRKCVYYKRTIKVSASCF